MKIFGYSFFEKAEAVEETTVADDRRGSAEIRALQYSDEALVMPWVPIRSRGFDGEKTAGELGNPVNLVPQFRQLRFRAYEAKLTSDIVKIVCNRFFKWVIGAGLKIQAEPNETILNLEGIKAPIDALTTSVEARFSLYAESMRSDFGGMCDLHDNAAKAFETSFMGGDCLVVLRVDDDLNVTVQIIDGQHVVNPLFNDQWVLDAKEAGHVILNGIEIDNKGQHVAFYVVNYDSNNLVGKVERIEARGSESDCLMAWMVYGEKHRIDHNRGITQIAPILEKVTKLDRYTEASVSSAEERAKLPWTIEHNKYSDGENPVVANIKRNIPGPVVANEDVIPYELGKLAAKNISATENKTVYNLPIGAKFAIPSSSAEIQYEPFFLAILKQICAACDIPLEVALQVYNSNYSASRAAINGWEYIIDIYRQKFAKNFYQRVYELWFYVQVLRGKIDAPGYIKAFIAGNKDVIEAYTKATFRGKNMPNIDPLKEANAMRVMLGDEYGPLITYEKASEQLGNGKWAENLKKLVKEREAMQGLPDAPSGPKVPNVGVENAERDKG